MDTQTQSSDGPSITKGTGLNVGRLLDLRDSINEYLATEHVGITIPQLYSILLPHFTKDEIKGVLSLMEKRGEVRVKEDVLSKAPTIGYSDKETSWTPILVGETQEHDTCEVASTEPNLSILTNRKRKSRVTDIYALLEGKSLTSKQIGDLVGLTAASLTPYLRQLVENNLFIRDKKVYPCVYRRHDYCK